MCIRYDAQIDKNNMSILRCDCATNVVGESNDAIKSAILSSFTSQIDDAL